MLGLLHLEIFPNTACSKKWGITERGHLPFLLETVSFSNSLGLDFQSDHNAQTDWEIKCIMNVNLIKP